MKLAFPSFVREWRDLTRFRSLEPSERTIVFYAAESNSWVHFERIISELTGRIGLNICYVTSSTNDQILTTQRPGISPFYVGLGAARTNLFKTLQAEIMVMTMPDLETFHIKRSRQSVHYVYVNHSMVSTHMIYRPEAFDNFDSMLCVGPHHLKEIRARENLYGLKKKFLIEHGYGRLDSIISSMSASGHPKPAPSQSRRTVLIAPSWGDNALMETCGAQLVQILLAAGHRVIARPHSMTLRHTPSVVSQLVKQFQDHPSFSMDMDMGSEKSLLESDIIVSDWSGAALEYAFGIERPVLYIDVPKKVNSPDFERLDCPPIEDQIRSQIGAVLSPDRLEEAPGIVDKLSSEPEAFRARIQELRAQWVYNIGASGTVGADYIASLAASYIGRKEADTVKAQ